MKFWPFIKLLPDKTNLKFVKYAPIMGVLSVIAVIASIFFTVWPMTPPCEPAMPPLGPSRVVAAWWSSPTSPATTTAAW